MKNYENTSYKVSEIVTKQYSTSFYSASLLFPKHIRQAIFNVYGFVRLADEIVDTFHAFNQTELLDNFEKDLKSAMASGISLNPILHSFVLITKQFNINSELIDAFLLACVMI